ncbi:unnamed protein product [Miscanthus lutarioriparius]|uniref:BEACH domain-containing protein n=1 Tax=Miscanthus lutarioriparius TaxID=422564 RepID=A0A811QX97_9POAL|nr:unnamed protein product [Miscanthus lutarioriparius]
MAEDARELPDSSPAPPREEGSEEQFAAVPLGDEEGVVEEEAASDPGMSTGTPATPYEPSPRPRLRPRPPGVPADAPQEVVRAVEEAIAGGADLLREVVSQEEGELAHSVVDVLLGTMSGADEAGDATGTGTGAPPTVMISSRAAVVAAELLPHLPEDDEPSPRTRAASGLHAALRACTRNRAMCSSAGLMAALLASAEKLFVEMDQGSRWDGTPLLQCIQMLGGHSLSVKDLRSWLDLVRKALGTSWATPLMLALEKAMGSVEAKGPAVSFEFDGESSGLLGPGDSRFSDTLSTATAAAAIAAAAVATSGKSSAMSAAAAASALAGEGTTHMPRLFSFLSSDNQGVEAYLHGQFLVVESVGGRGKKASLHFTYAFKPQCWYFVGLEHTNKHSLLGKGDSELRLYVDGSLYESRPFEFPRISKPLAFCCIGTNPPPTIAGLQRRRRQCPLFAEMGPVYIFKEPVGPDRMRRLASRGGDTLPSFGNGAGLPWKATNDHVKSMAEESFTLNNEIGGSLHLLYHPSLLTGRFCPDSSPSGSSATHRRPAEVLGLVHVSSRVRPAESLWALAYGGPMALLPLTIGNVHVDSLEPTPGDLPSSLATVSLSAPVFRIISQAIQHPGNNEELCRAFAPELLSRVLHYLLQALSKLESGEEALTDEELVAAIVSLCQSQRNNHELQVQLFSSLLLDLNLWSSCNYGLQKKLLSSLADMVFTESACMRDAKVMQMLLDGCRRCYWVIQEPDSIDNFALTGTKRSLGEVNALVDELLVVIELLLGAASSTAAADDVRCLIGFIVDCPQPNQVARVLHLIYRLIVQPNVSRANLFSQSFITSGGVEALLVLLQREAKAGNKNILDHSGANFSENNVPKDGSSNRKADSADTRSQVDETQSAERHETVFHEESAEHEATNANDMLDSNIGSDGIVVGIIHILGALVGSGHLKFDSGAGSPNIPGGNQTTLNEEGNTVSKDRVSLLLFALQKAFQAAPRRLMTANVYMALISAAINVSSADESLNLYDSGHRFEHIQLLLVLLCSLPYASRAFQARAIQDLLFLACSHLDNRTTMTSIAEWPEWILEVLISNHEMGTKKNADGVSIGEIEDLIHNFLIIMLEHSIRQKDGWKDVEATIHCAEWLSMVGGSSTGDQRIRREESLPIFKRRLLGDLLDFSARELQVQQTGVIAAAAAGVAAEGLSPEEAKVQAENAAYLSVALAENAIVILMLVEDHLRSQGQHFCTSLTGDSITSSTAMASLAASRSNSLGTAGKEPMAAGASRRASLSSDAGGLPLDLLTSMADSNGQISAAVMERLTAATAAEPYESVKHAFVSYGSCIADLGESWKYRSRLWYGVGIPPKADIFGGGGSGWESWKSVLEKDSNGIWIEFPLVKKSVAVLQALLLDESGLGGGLGIGGGSGPGMGVMTALYQLLDSDQPFLCMLRMVLVSMREDDNGEGDAFTKDVSIKDVVSEGMDRQAGSMMPFDINSYSSPRKPRSALLWSVLGPILNMPITESKRQRVLVASSILYSEVWHAIGRDRKPLRKQYIELILPPFIAILRRWRPLLAGIHELTSSDGQNPLIADDRALAADALPIEISNFEYLMELNTLAGRSYNDITQPIGALNPERLKKFQERYSTFEDPIIPKFHYGSHYSSAGTVLYYLFGVESFTTLSIQLQGGKFDHADRMFSDISGTWDSVLEDMSDVKELVPEMFYLPEVFTNINGIDFGATQLGGKLDSVELPPWAENHVDFVHKHRKALESEHVSAHLHEWIDLIFGYKQRGKEAIMANNVFFYITYEGTVDIDKITDPVERRATQDQIAYFGQTPSQLLTVPHMKRKPLAEVLQLQNHDLAYGSQIYNRFRRLCHSCDASLRKKQSRVNKGHSANMVSCGHVDGSLKLISPDGAKTIETASGHIAPVTCLALSPDSNYLVTGSRDTTVILWRIHQTGSSHKKNAQQPPPTTPTTPRSPLSGSTSSLSETKRRRVEGPMHLMRGHLGEVTCCSVSPDLGLVASSSNATGVLLHSLRTGRLIRRPDVEEPHAICLSSQGIILVWNETKKTLSTFTINGLPIATSVRLPFSGQVSCINVSTDGHFALIGTSLFNNYKCDSSTETGNHELGPNGTDDVSKNSEQSETEQSVHVPSICFVDLHKLKVNIKNLDSPSLLSFVQSSPENFF